MRGCSCRGTAGFAHVSCLAEQAKILFAEAEENNLDGKVLNARWLRWQKCSLCEQEYHGAVCCALGWASWKTYLVRPKLDRARLDAIRVLVSGLSAAGHHEDALSVKEAELAVDRRLGAPEGCILVTQSNLAGTYQKLGRLEEARNLYRDVYSGELKLYGAEHCETLTSAFNYASNLVDLQRFEEAKSLFLKTLPVARRVLGESHDLTLRLRWSYALTLYRDPSATLADLREAVETLVETERIARRVLGGSHPITKGIEYDLQKARAALRTREPKK